MLVCPACGEEAASDQATWCEACGADLGGSVGAVGGPSCVECGASSDLIMDGFCGQCGRKQPGPRDHLAEALDGVAAVTDKGLRHHHNEDAFAIGVVEQGWVAVVCDGVSSTDHSDDASQGAADAARDRLVGDLAGIDVGDAASLEAAMVAAVDAAQAAAARVEYVEDGRGPASTTIVSAALLQTTDGFRSVVGWLGDSRAYWVDADETVQLTVDDEIDGSISRWLGRDAGDVTPSVHIADHPANRAERGRRHLLVCTDGLWRYADTTDAMEQLVADSAGENVDPAGLAESLVDHAVEAGGHDNVTVAVIAAAR